MNTALPLWRELAILASYRGGWILPVLALLCFFGAIWALFNRLGSSFLITETQPPVRIDQDFAKRDQDARRVHALMHQQPTRSWGEPAAKGAKRGYATDHQAVVSLAERRTGR